MLLFKALEILGFPPFTTFELTSYEDICSAFLNRLMMVMKNRKQAAMKARELKNINKKKKYGYQARKREMNWRMEIVKINEAFQVCNIDRYIFESKLIFLPWISMTVG